MRSRSKTKNIEKILFRELKNNLERFENRNKPNIKLDKLILSLENEAYKKALKAEINFNELVYKKHVVLQKIL